MKSVSEFFVQFGLHELLEGTLKNIFTEGGKIMFDRLKSNNFGFGTNDEALFLSACVYALSNGAEKAKLMLVLNVINSFPKSVVKKIVRTIGKDEQEVEMPVAVFDKNGDPVKDKKGNPVIQKVKVSLNSRGGKTLQMLSEYDTEAEIRAVLEASAMTSTVTGDIHDFLLWIKNNPQVRSLVDGVNSLVDHVEQLKDSYESSLQQPTFLERLASKLDIFGITR